MVLAYLDRTDRIREVAEQSILPKMGTQIADDGSLPQELKRTLSLHYSTFALEALMEANQITSQIGINLWSTPAPNGKVASQAVDYLYPYYLNPESWKFKQIKPFDQSRAAILLYEAGTALGNQKYIDTAKRLKSKDYKGVITKDIVYKKYKDYELILTVDFAETDNPAPFVVYLHGGGWARGNNGSSRSLSQYLAKQKGDHWCTCILYIGSAICATVKVSIQDVWDAVKYIREHAAELNITPECFGFLGTSAGAHLAAVAAMTVPERSLVGYSGIYDLEKAGYHSKDERPSAYWIFLWQGS